MNTRPGDGTGALEKAIDILDEISRHPSGISQGDLAARLELPRTTIYRLLATLVARGLVSREDVGRTYSLGMRYVEIAHQNYAMQNLVGAAAQELRDLRDLTGETTYIGKLEGAAVISLERYDGAHDHRSNAELGLRKAVHATGQGKALLAALPAAQQKELLDKIHLEPLTPHTLTDRRHLKRQLQLIKARGWSIDDEENVPGVRCVAAAVIDSFGMVRGAISLAGPAYRLPISRLELLGPELVEAARRIGLRLEGIAGAPSSSGPLVVPGSASLYGAYPYWDNHRAELIWADTLAPALRRANADTQTRTRLDKPITGLFLQGTELCATHDQGAVLIGPEGNIRPLPEWRPISFQAITNRPNGEIWAALRGPHGTAIGRLNSTAAFRRQWYTDETIECLRWTNDGKLLYATAQQSGAILLFRPGSDRIHRITSVPRGAGQLSGIAIDALGRIWTTMRHGWSVMTFRDDGVLERTTPLPVPFSTGIEIGGKELDTVYVTTARQPVMLNELKIAPLSGHVFRFPSR
ncbi:IclR family transcriptional regulator domain-containing protein [Candidimonas nitroreducens]|uniref:IclR family transcriptional regulator n=1 Tax=Candidimonas nitroreducens TaxID=683354 RepID=A0A225LZF0_9BURK|nr:IclR family transcriptional regulator C-terminal domain-containing protein [Candidimonas nitroreducens]OWT54525.1 IclR family transcriptional regulator [Candidimonas nitroreducens]